MARRSAHIVSSAHGESQKGSGRARALHVAIIMDGNGRWAESRGLARAEGHQAGAASVRRIVEAAPGCGIRALTLFAFSADNWGRPQSEVAVLMALLEEYLVREGARCREKGVRLRVIGARDRLSPSLREAIESVETLTFGGDVLDLRLALSYSSREAILEAARRLGGHAPISRGAFTAALNDALGGTLAGGGATARATRGCGEVDLLIRTGGEQRLSDFLLWECAYAELYFTQVMWPDFDGEALRAALAEFRTRQRRFGRLPEPRGGAFARTPTLTSGSSALAPGAAPTANASGDYWLR